jgi:hypothetical protein
MGKTGAWCYFQSVIHTSTPFLRYKYKNRSLKIQDELGENSWYKNKWLPKKIKVSSIGNGNDARIVNG